MPDPTATVPTSTVVNTPVPAAPATPESKMFPTTPNGTTSVPATPPVATPPAPASTTPPVPPMAMPPATSPATTTEPKPPTEPIPPAAQPAPATPPTDYDLKLPENSPLSAEDLATILKESKESGLSKEEAEEVLKSQNQVAVNTAARTSANIKAQQDLEFKETQTKWIDTAKTDPEIGGDKFTETVALSSRAFKQLASPLLQKLVEDTGLGNHPELIRMMSKIGRMMGEDKLRMGTVGDSPAPRDAAEVLYGKTTPNK